MTPKDGSLPEKRIRILTVITKLELGGAQQVALNTLAQLDGKKYEKFLISGKGGMLDGQAESLPGIRVSLWRTFKHPIRPLCDLITLVRLRRFMKRQGIQLIHTHSSKAGLLGRLAAAWAGVPAIVHTVHGWPFHEYQPVWLRSLYVLLERLAARRSHVMVAVSEATQQKGLENRIGRPEQYRIVFPGSDLSLFRPADAAMRRAVRKSFQFEEDDLLVGMVACLKPQKDARAFVAAAERVLHVRPDVRFLLVGDGVERKAVEKAVRSAKLHPQFILAGWRQDVHRLIPAFDILALTSRWEGLPCVLAQAMASQVPVVATRVEGAKEAIEPEKTGLLVAPGDPDAFARALLRLIDDAGLRKRMGEQGRYESEKFGLPYMVGRLNDLYQTLLREE